MEIKLYDCPHCLTNGVLPTNDWKCPNCKSLLSEANRQLPAEVCPEIEDSHGTGSWRRPPRICYEAFLKLLTNPFLYLTLGVLGLLLAPVVFAGIAIAGNEKPQINTHGPDEVIRAALKWSWACLLASWLITEFGLVRSKTKFYRQFLIRVFIYPYILLLAFISGIIFVFSWGMGP